MTSRQFAIIAGITFVVGMVWLTMSIIFTTKASIPTSPELQTLLEPITPTFNSRVLDLINSETLDISEITITDPPPPSPSPEPTPTPSTVLEISPNPDEDDPPEQATTSADLNI